MSHPDPDASLYYPEEYDYEVYYQNELKNYQTSTYKTTSLDGKSNKRTIFPTISYVNERKCPIYVHNIKKDSSVYNNYNEKLTNTRKAPETGKSCPQTTNKLVLDKLEETYWATWKPKKENGPRNKLKPLGGMGNLGFSDLKPVFQEHKVGAKDSNKPHGDINDNIIKYFKAKRFESGSTTDSVTQEKGLNKSNVRRMRMAKQNSKSQEIQTEVHCPVILEESKYEDKNVEKLVNSMQVKDDESVEEANTEEAKPSTNLSSSSHKDSKRKSKKNSKGRIAQLSKASTKQEDTIITEPDIQSDGVSTFIEHKDSIEITKKKQEKSGSKEHFQQPKCIRLFRKSGLATGYLKGGTYPLKSCLRKESSQRGNFRLGPPGSPLFVTSGSFLSRRKNK